MTNYCVVKYTKHGVFVGVMAGMGRNKGTWDTSAKSKRTAQRWAAECRRYDKSYEHRVEPAP